MNNRVRFILCILLYSMLALFVSPATVSAQEEKGSDPDYIFYKGNTLYEEGKYDKAIREYSGLLEQGLESGNVYFNLGNSYFKKGGIGMAILNYERAKKLIPGDTDLMSNYNYARSLIKGNVPDKSVPWFERVFKVFDFLTINGLTVFLSAMFVFTFFFLLSGLFFLPLKRYYRYVLPVLLIIFMAGALSLYNRVSMLGKEAIIISENADAKFEPLDNATMYFTLYEGMKISIVETNRDWCKIKRADGKTGWIRAQEIEKI